MGEISTSIISQVHIIEFLHGLNKRISGWSNGASF